MDADTPQTGVNIPRLFTLSFDAFDVNGYQNSNFRAFGSTMRQGGGIDLRYQLPQVLTVASVQFNNADARFTASIFQDSYNYGSAATPNDPSTANTSKGIPYTTTITWVEASYTPNVGDVIVSYCGFTTGKYANNRGYINDLHLFASALVDNNGKSPPVRAGTSVIQDDIDGTIAKAIQNDLNNGKTVQATLYSTAHSDAFQLIGQFRYDPNVENVYVDGCRIEGADLQVLLQAGPANELGLMPGLQTTGTSYTVADPHQIDDIRYYPALGYAAIAYADNPYLYFYSGFTTGSNVCPLNGAAAGCEFPLFAQVNPSHMPASGSPKVPGGSAQIAASQTINGSAVAAGTTVIDLSTDKPNLASGINIGKPEPAPTTTGAAPAFNSRIYLFDDTGVKSYLVTAFDTAANTIAVTGTPNLSGGTSRWIITPSPTGRPTSYCFNNPAQSGTNAQIKPGTVGTTVLGDGTLGTTLTLDVSSKQNVNDNTPNGAGGSTLYLDSATGQKTFKIASLSISGSVGTIVVPGIVTLSGSSAWTINMGYNTTPTTSLQTANLSNLAVGDTVQNSSGLRVGDFVSAYSPQLAVSGPNNSTARPLTVLTQVYSAAVVAITDRFSGTLSRAMPTDLPAGTFWNQAKSVIGLAMTRTLIDNYNTHAIDTRMQCGLNHAVFDHFLDHGHKWSIDNYGKAWGLQDVAIRNSVLTTFSLTDLMAFPAKSDGFKLSNNALILGWCYGTNLTVSGRTATITSPSGGAGELFENQYNVKKSAGMWLHIDNAVGQKDFKIVDATGVNGYSMKLDPAGPAPVLSGASSWSITPDTEGGTSRPLKGTRDATTGVFPTNDPYNVSSGTDVSTYYTNPALCVYGGGNYKPDPSILTLPVLNPTAAFDLYGVPITAASLVGPTQA